MILTIFLLTVFVISGLAALTRRPGGPSPG
jgi:hypothetical protein